MTRQVEGKGEREAGPECPSVAVCREQHVIFGSRAAFVFFKSYDGEGRTAERGCSGQHVKLSIGLQIDTRSMQTTIGSVYCLGQYLLKSD
jgi:hypothetical protein